MGSASVLHTLHSQTENSLLQDVVMTTTLNGFKRRFDKIVEKMNSLPTTTSHDALPADQVAVYL